MIWELIVKKGEVGTTTSQRALLAMAFRNEVWKDILIPYLSDDEVVTKLWMSAPHMQRLITQQLKYLVINLRRVSPSPQQGNCPYYLHPPFFSMLKALQYLWILVPAHLQGKINQHYPLPVFPPSLRFLESNSKGILNLCFDNSDLPLHNFSSWISSRDDITLGPLLSVILILDGRLLRSQWKVALQCIEEQRYTMPDNANLLRHLTHLTEGAYLNLRALDSSIWDSAIFKCVAERITSCSVRISQQSDAHWLIERFPNLIHFHGWSPIIPPRLTILSRIIATMEEDITLILPSSLTKLSMDLGSGPGSWPLKWPQQLRELNVNTNTDNLTRDEFRLHISTLPASLTDLTYQYREWVDRDWWDVKTTSSLPRGLKRLTVHKLPLGLNQEELAVLAALPPGLTVINVNHSYTDHSVAWIDDLPTAALKLLPVGLTSLSLSSREVIDPSKEYEPSRWSSQVRDLSTLIERFPNLTRLVVEVVCLSDPMPAFPDTVTDIFIGYHNVVKATNTFTDLIFSSASANVSLGDVKWPSRLENLRISSNIYSNRIQIMGRTLESLPDSVTKLSIQVCDAGLVSLPRKWPKKLAEVKISADYVELLVDNLLEPDRGYLPNTDIVLFRVGDHRLRYSPITKALQYDDVP